MAQSPYLDQLPLDDLDHSTFNLPSRELLADTRFLDYVKICIPLYKSSAKGEFAVVRRILQDNNQQLIRLSITTNRDTVLHVAVTSGNFRLVEYLVGEISDDDLSLQNAHGYTALSLAASHGDAKMARLLVGRAPLLRTIRGKANMMPLHLAAAYGRREMTNDLYNLDGWTNGEKRLLFLKCVHSDLLDIARRMLTESHSSFLEPREQKMYIHGVLSTLALKSYAFEDVRPNIIWRVIMSYHIRIIIQGIFSVEVRPPTEKSEATLLFRAIWRKNLLELSKRDISILVRGPKFEKETGPIYPYRLAFVALEKGNTRFLVELLDAFPDIMWMINDENLSIFHVAALHRDESIYRIIHETGPMLEVLHGIKDGNGNNMLHLIGTNPRGNLFEAVPRAAFQMQRQLSWFKEVEAMVPSEFVLEKNNDGLTPDKVFENNHKQLVSEGGEWLKKTIAQCIVVVALIATVGFTTNFTFYGGYDGLPIFLRSNSFLTFVVLNGISFVLSIASAIIFLYILWTFYHQDDFLRILPKRLMVAVTLFFFSIISLIVAFTINFFLLYRKKTHYPLSSLL